MRKEERIKALKELLSKIEELRPLNHEDSVFIKWHDAANRKLREFYVDHPYVKEFETIEFCDFIFRKEGQIYPY